MSEIKIGSRVVFTNSDLGEPRAGIVVDHKPDRDHQSEYTGNREWYVRFDKPLFDTFYEAFCASRDLEVVPDTYSPDSGFRQTIKNMKDDNLLGEEAATRVLLQYDAALAQMIEKLYAKVRDWEELDPEDQKLYSLGLRHAIDLLEAE